MKERFSCLSGYHVTRNAQFPRLLLDPDVLSETVVPFFLDAATDTDVALNDKVVALRTVEAACEKAATRKAVCRIV
jgi:hypothetical protein